MFFQEQEELGFIGSTMRFSETLFLRYPPTFPGVFTILKTDFDVVFQ